MDIEFSTRDAPPPRRSSDWHSAIAQAYFPLDLGFRDAARFDGSLAIWKFGEVSLSRLTSEALLYRRNAHHLRKVASEEEYLVTVPVLSPVSFSQCGRDVLCRPGGFIVERSHEPYEFAHAEAADLWVLKIGASLLSSRIRAPDRFCSLAFDATTGTGGLLADLLPLLPKRVASLASMSRATIGRQLVDLIVLALSEDPRTLTSGQSSVRAAHLSRIEMIVRQRLGEPGLDAETSAGAAGISLRYLHDLFRDTGQSLGHWIREQRLEAARAAFADPGSRDTVAVVAYRAGFADHAQFSRCFRSRYGLSPRAYRQQVREQGGAPLP